MPRLRRLWLRAFRNYDRADFEVPGGTTVLVGPNGAGKSNLLEAIYLVATGRSHRTAHEAETIRLGETAARVRALVSRRGHDEELEITLVREDERLVSQMRVNGAVTPRGTVLGRLPVVLAAPWDLELVRGSGGGRRRLLDGALAQLSPAYFFALHRYHRVLMQRNAELRRRAAAGLDPWDAQLLALGVRITGYRSGYVDKLRPQAAAWFDRLGGTGTLDVAYQASWTGASEEDRAAQAGGQIERLRADEYRRGVTLSGPHRDDLNLTLDARPMRAFGSQGQWRTAMLALRLAERGVMAAELGESPVLLLDDALAELDERRRGRLLELEDEAQVLVTATEMLSSGRNGHAFRVDAGTIAESAWSPRFETS
jgi:DNA replication and repair protein RecF